MTLNPDDLKVTSFPTETQFRVAAVTGGGQSWPDVCTCIGICQPTEDLYCSGGCAPETTIPVIDQAQ